ncbi:hypothetical protein HRW18_16325 [Streptomyces lunaelactis]|uniref:hypothetical protein n=1 Tax=Streptomyces lunaelactis TaxID=1535768 RepID=UPI001585CF14|nr:hypothetical protein [Streptomyces lunaelactis]NUK01791.1 hypothetical protein [Streptomyces lunaelactis]NUK09543.1 hypothetical protein [Streptomyces lunaelactis]NUK14973.1 hypothetical protein [Streptomyces lunaelactis]NUK51542.1 hypothetical protein [Streptomyces lunaelactis]NUK58456.1 hypothetical protein [Streptomyces lunaelactis]
MWPGQQPPGGEQNPQDQNPYQQPGYQQPNPYQQPGVPQPGYQQPEYQQPNPYQQPTVPQYAVPGQPPGGPQPPQDDKKKTTVIAIVAATAVVVAAVVTGVIVLKDDGKGTDKADGKNVGESKKPASDTPTQAPASPTENPRGVEDAKPTIAGWKVVTNPKHGTQFDVPAGWEVAGSGMATGFEDEKKGDGSAVVMMSAPAHYKSKWCTFDTDKDGKLEEWGMGTVGTKGGKGATDSATAAYNEAGNWVWAGYAQTEPKGTVKITKAVPYTTKSGLSGSVSTGTAIGVKKENKCETDGKSIAFTFKNSKGDFTSWVLYGNKGVPDEVPDATIQQILSTVRVAGTPAG